MMLRMKMISVAGGQPQMGSGSGIVGGGLQGLLIETGITIGEILITNYIDNQSSALQKKIRQKATEGKNWSKARRNTPGKQRFRKYSYKIYNYRKRGRS